MLYATDASLYQVEPLGVLVPADADDVATAVEICSEFGVPMLPRGGGTSLAGQCTARAVVIDASASCQGIREFSKSRRTIYAQAGVKLDDINGWLTRERTGLFYAPDPATSAQATVGGCIGNNASGSRSVLYGRTVDSVLAMDAVIASGARVKFAPNAGASDPIALKLADGVIRIVRKYEALIRTRYPKTMRRNAGYALDSILSQLDAGATAQSLDLSKLIVGSAGTLAFAIGAELKLFDQPACKGLALMSFATLDEAIAAVIPILSTGPSAVELVDDVVVEAALNNLECRAYVEAFPKVLGNAPAAVLYVEYHTGSQTELRARFDALRQQLPDAERWPVREVTDAVGMGNAWKLRKAGEPLLHGLPGARKPLTFVEDNAVPVEHLAEFVRRFRDIVQRHGTRAAFYAHASVGVLHVRPLINPHDDNDMRILREIAVEVADLAKSLGGVMSGEHGDGKVRGPLLERFYGQEVMEAFREVKALFDPQGLFNPGNITRPGPIASITSQLRIDPQEHAERMTAVSAAAERPHAPAIETYFSYADQDDFGHAIEMCNGAGVCRKSSGGAMCPSYRATMDERHSTRGRGNALRLAITGQLTDGGAGKPTGEQLAARFADPETIATLDLCLSCKACKSECPSNVDIARLKSEYTAQRLARGGRLTLASYLTGHVRTLNRFGAVMPGVANFVNSLAPVRSLIKRAMHIHPKRTLPSFSRSLYGQWGAAKGSTAAPQVALFADCFTTYNESPIGLHAKRVLESFGYSVTLPKVGCCARSMMSVGMLAEASAVMDTTLEQLRASIESPEVRAILFVEPSCLSAIKDDWLLLKGKSALSLRHALAAKAMLVEQFVDEQWDTHPVRPAAVDAEHVSQRLGSAGPVLFHAHCHQKALWGAASSAGALRRAVGTRLQVLDTTCCGMAGSFGYDKNRYELSMRIANLGTPDDGSASAMIGGGVLPHVRREPTGIVVATGTSCRHQVKDGTEHQRTAIHPIELLSKIWCPQPAPAD